MEHSLTIIAAISIVLVVIALVDLVRRKFKNLAFGLVWLLIVLVIPVVGPILYLLLRKGMSATQPRMFDPKFHHHKG